MDGIDRGLWFMNYGLRIMDLGWHTYDDETREIKDITADREAECTWHWLSRWLQENTMRVNRLCCIFLQAIE